MTKRIKPDPYVAHIRSVRQSYDKTTGGPLPLQLTIEVPSYASGLAIMRDIASSRLPITVNLAAVHYHLPESRR